MTFPSQAIALKWNIINSFIPKNNEQIIELGTKNLTNICTAKQNDGIRIPYKSCVKIIIIHVFLLTTDN